MFYVIWQGCMRQMKYRSDVDKIWRRRRNEWFKIIIEPVRLMWNIHLSYKYSLNCEIILPSLYTTKYIYEYVSEAVYISQEVA